ncbi:MAG: hypothetical protein ABUL77_00405 [Bacteroidota bacterium]
MSVPTPFPPLQAGVGAGPRAPQSSSSTAAALAVDAGRGDDIFELGRRAAAARDVRLGARASFVRARQLLGTGAWRGPRDATESYVEATDLAALGGFGAAATAGVRLLVGGGAIDAHRDARGRGARSIWRLPYRGGESSHERQASITGVRDLLRANVDGGIDLWGVMPTPEGEAEGLDTLRLVATLRLDLPEIPHVVLDVALLGPRLAQMALGFGGDELWAPVVSERALRLGGNANNPAMTRKEAAILIRGAGLAPCERLTLDTYREESE